MEIGQKVTSDLYAEYGAGTVVSKNKIFAREFYKVFFAKIRNIIEIQEEDLKSIADPLDLFKSKAFSSPIEFKLNYLAYSIETMALSERALSPFNFKINLLPHQLIALDFVMNQFKPRCLLADEVDLGKTIEAALIMEELKLRSMVKRVLIVAPAGLTDQWKEELKLKFSEDFYLFNRETFNSCKQQYGKETNYWLKFDQIITSIDFLKPKQIHAIEWDSAIEEAREIGLDEKLIVFYIITCENVHVLNCWVQGSILSGVMMKNTTIFGFATKLRYQK